MPSFRILLVTVAAAVLVLHSGNPRVSAQEQLPRVGVLRVENRTGNRTYDTLADTIRTTVSLSLLLMGDYDVIERNASVGANPVETADAIPVDTLVWGSVTEEADDTLTVSLTVFDRASARVVTSDTERSPTLLGVFDASDRLVRRVIGSFSGRRVGFGSVRLNVVGTGSYRVMLDGTSMGADLTSLDRVLAGRYRLVVEQRLPTGYRRIVSERVEITEGDRLVVDVHLLDAAAVASAERERIRDALDAVLAGDPGPGFRAAPVEALLADYARSTPDSHELSWYRDRLDLQLEYRRILDHRYYVDGAFAIPDSLADGFLAASYRVVHDRDMRVSDPNTPVDGELAENRFRRFELEQLVRRNIGAVVGIMVLASDYAAVTGDLPAMERTHRLVQQLTRDGLWPRDAVPAVERRAALAAVMAHDRAAEHQRPRWQLLAIGAGVAGVATTGYLFGSGVVVDSLNDADAAYAAYQASTDSAEIADLRDEVE